MFVVVITVAKLSDDGLDYESNSKDGKKWWFGKIFKKQNPMGW